MEKAFKVPSPPRFSFILKEKKKKGIRNFSAFLLFSLTKEKRKEKREKKKRKKKREEETNILVPFLFYSLSIKKKGKRNGNRIKTK